jgi:hypothetical protein
MYDIIYSYAFRTHTCFCLRKIQVNVNLIYWGDVKNLILLFCTYNTVSVTLKRVSKRSSFRYAFQEHLLKFLMLAVTSELLLRAHFIAWYFNLQLFVYLPALPTFIFATYNFPSIMFWTCFKFKGQNRKSTVLYSFYKPFCRTCLLYSTRRCAPRALKNACEKLVSYKTRIINNYFCIS